MAIGTRERLINLLNAEMLTIINNFGSDTDLKFIVTENVQKYKGNITGKEVFLVVTFGSGTLSYQSLLQPAVINVVCNQKRVNEVLAILNIFVETFNLKKDNIDSDYIIQSYTVPTVTGKFEEMGSDFGTICFFNASFSVSPNISTLKKVVIDGEEVGFLNAKYVYNNANDSKSVPSTNNLNAFSKSVMQFGTLSITIQLFFSLKSAFILKCINASNKSGSVSQNADFKIKITFDDVEFDIGDMKLMGFFIVQQQESIPILEVSFTL